MSLIIALTTENHDLTKFKSSEVLSCAYFLLYISACFSPSLLQVFGDACGREGDDELRAWTNFSMELLSYRRHKIHYSFAQTLMIFMNP